MTRAAGRILDAAERALNAFAGPDSSRDAALARYAAEREQAVALAVRCDNGFNAEEPTPVHGTIETAEAQPLPLDGDVETDTAAARDADIELLDKHLQDRRLRGRLPRKTIAGLQERLTRLRAQKTAATGHDQAATAEPPTPPVETATDIETRAAREAEIDRLEGQLQAEAGTHVRPAERGAAQTRITDIRTRIGCLRGAAAAAEKRIRGTEPRRPPAARPEQTRLFGSPATVSGDGSA